MAGRGPQPVFYYEFGSVACYLAAERILSGLSEVPEWEPVLGTQPDRIEANPDLEVVARRIRQQGLQPLRWPAQWPPETRMATLAAAYSKAAGRVVAFSLACFRQVFAAGRDLGDADTVLIAAAACELHPTALLKGVSLRSTAAALTRANRRAADAGVRSLPAIQVGDEVFEGDRAVEMARVALAGMRR